MCDFSLESVKHRAAEKDEDLVLRKFITSKGFVNPKDESCAVCCKSGVEMTVHLDGKLVTSKGIEEFNGEALAATFDTLSSNPYGIGGSFYRDGLILASGSRISLQNIPEGTRATITKALPIELVEAVKGEVAFDPDEKIETVVPALVD